SMLSRPLRSSRRRMMNLTRNTLAAGALLGLQALLLPLAAHAAATADKCKFEITGNDLMQYDKTQLDVPGDCAQVTVTLHHAGKLPAQAMGHTWVPVNSTDVHAA